MQLWSLKWSCLVWNNGEVSLCATVVRNPLDVIAAITDEWDICCSCSCSHSVVQVPTPFILLTLWFVYHCVCARIVVVILQCSQVTTDQSVLSSCEISILCHSVTFSKNCLSMPAWLPNFLWVQTAKWRVCCGYSSFSLKDHQPFVVALPMFQYTCNPWSLLYNYRLL